VTHDDPDVIRERVLATIAHAQCLKICPVLDQVRDFLSRGSGGEDAGRSEPDLEAAREAIESRLARIGVITSALSTIGSDAELGHLAVSRAIREFWGRWTPDRLADMEAVLRDTTMASFQEAIKCLTQLAHEHELFQQFLCDVHNQRPHDAAVLEFLRRHLQALPDEEVSVHTLSGQGVSATIAGLARVLGMSESNARRVIRSNGLEQHATTGHRGAKLYDISGVAEALREKGVQFAERIPREIAEDEHFFRPLEG
jgi:hypothetical protein